MFEPTETKTEAAPVPEYLKQGGKINVKALLVALNIKQKDLAQKYNISATELNKVLKGRRKTLHIREAVARELNMGVVELWGE